MIHKEKDLKNIGQCKGPNYGRIARLWSEVLGITITEKQVALCLSQMHLSHLLDHPDDTTIPLDITSSIFAFEAFQGEIE